MEQNVKKYIVANSRLIGLSAAFIWLSVNAVLLSTNYLLEAQRSQNPLNTWEPWSWGISSYLMVFILIPFVTVIGDKFIQPQKLWLKIVTHVATALVFSILHIAGMVAIRKAWYFAAGSYYEFGNVLFELLYELRKDYITYFTIVFVVFGYRIFILRLQGEAVYISENEEETQHSSPERFLVKKLGKEFLINIDDIDWIEAAGNYVNLHVKERIYPMRSTMTNIKQILPEKTFRRIHRSYIVNLNRVAEIHPQESGDYKLSLTDGTQLNFSRRYREAFKEDI